ncbi:MAG: zf-HC2 domain-containing protein [Chloroflexi bacterium]|nr:zf-HC2 domain-containing protein [Chloroflexota bacterium]
MKKHLNCGALLESLSEYVDGVLGDALCAEIESHVADCDDCRVVVDTLKKTIYLYHETSEKTEIPIDVRTRLFHRLNLDDFIQEKKQV